MKIQAHCSDSFISAAVGAGPCGHCCVSDGDSVPLPGHRAGYSRRQPLRRLNKWAWERTLKRQKQPNPGPR